MRTFFLSLRVFFYKFQPLKPLLNVCFTKYTLKSEALSNTLFCVNVIFFTFK
jgi:hypothetical protein